MRILLLSPWFPFPPTNGTELRLNAILRGLAAVHDVSLISFQRRRIEQRDLDIGQQVCRDVKLVPWREYDPHSGRAIAGLLSTRPRSVVDTYSAEMDDLVSSAGNKAIDVVIASQYLMAPYVHRLPGVPAILEELELGAFREPRGRVSHTSQLRRWRGQLTWAKHAAFIRNLLPRFAACTVVSERERSLIKEIAPTYRPVATIPNAVNLSDYHVATPKEPATIIFTGSLTYQANHEAMDWFLSDVFPRIRGHAPDARLVITGDHAGLPLPHIDDVTRTGLVKDVKIPLAAATISVVPLHYGGGTRLKILEAMALRTPVVSTSVGAEGLDVVDGEHLLLADSAEAFASAVLRLLGSAQLRNTLVQNAQELVRRQYDWATVMPLFLDVVRAASERSPYD